MLLAVDIPGVDAAIKAAEADKSWEAILVVIIMVAMMLALAYVVKLLMNQSERRESRMALRIDKLEDYIEGELRDIAVASKESMERNTAAFLSLKEALDNRACMWDPGKQKQVVDMAILSAKTAARTSIHDA